MSHILRQFAFSGLCALFCVTAAAQDDEPSLLSPGARLDAFELELGAPDLTEQEAERIARDASIIRTQASECVDERESQIERLESNLLILGDTQPEPEEAETPAQDGEPAATVAEEPRAVVQQRTEFEQQVVTLRNEIAGCKLTQLKAREINEQALNRLGSLLARRLMSHGQPSLEALRDDLQAPTDTLRSFARKATALDRMASVSLRQSLILLLLGGAGFAAGFGARALIRRWSEGQRGRGGEPAIRVVYARTIGRWLRIILPALAVGIGHSFFLAPDATSLPLVRLFYALAALGVVGILVDWCTGPYSPGSEFLEDDALETAMRHRGQALGVALALGYTAFGLQWLGTPPPEEGLVLRAIITIVTGATIIWLVRGARLLPAMRGRLLLIRGALILAAMATVIAELLGYRNLANHLLKGALGSIAAGFILWVLLWLVRATVDGIINGKTDVSYRVRNWLGMRPNENSPELSWLRLILSVALWLGFAVVLISLWDSTGSALPKLTAVVTQGIALNDEYTLVPRDVLKGLVVFGLIIALTAWIKARMTKRWLRDMGMDRGAREALVTLGGYVGFLIAILLGLILSGVDLGGLAFVLGALGVGIGFGLQNIVSNFVSGLILLFERPIKSGDFVSVGDVEGIVKRIRIRSTEIESLDRRNIIVPNSELVSTQVTNWVLHDPFGRLTLSIGVAYGSDTERVRDILEQVASENSEVLSKGPAPAPKALFMGFGDSALDFELRCWIRQIEKRFGVTSELNFAIDQAFRDANIEIPFPQRDLHLRSWSSNAAPGGPDDHTHNDPDAEDGTPSH
ncbi:MAG: mechanosensitive ion channel domain-containing protein [Gammaproteobacteria bacterium]